MAFLAIHPDFPQEPPCSWDSIAEWRSQGGDTAALRSEAVARGDGDLVAAIDADAELRRLASAMKADADRGWDFTHAVGTDADGEAIYLAGRDEIPAGDEMAEFRRLHGLSAEEAALVVERAGEIADELEDAASQAAEAAAAVETGDLDRALDLTRDVAATLGDWGDAEAAGRLADALEAALGE